MDTPTEYLTELKQIHDQHENYKDEAGVSVRMGAIRAVFKTLGEPVYTKGGMAVLPPRQVLDINDPERVPYPLYITRREEATIGWLLELARSVYFAMDDCEVADGPQMNPGDKIEQIYILTEDNAKKLEDGLNALDLLPDDCPGYTMSPNAKAAWALRRLYPDQVQPTTADEPATPDLEDTHVVREDYMTDPGATPYINPDYDNEA